MCVSRRFLYWEEWGRDRNGSEVKRMGAEERVVCRSLFIVISVLIVLIIVIVFLFFSVFLPLLLLFHCLY